MFCIEIAFKELIVLIFCVNHLISIALKSIKTNRLKTYPQKLYRSLGASNKCANAFNNEDALKINNPAFKTDLYLIHRNIIRITKKGRIKKVNVKIELLKEILLKKILFTQGGGV